jgi:hypothetical protein
MEEKVHYRVHKSQPLDPIMNHFNPVQTPSPPHTQFLYDLTYYIPINTWVS